MRDWFTTDDKGGGFSDISAEPQSDRGGKSPSLQREIIPCVGY